MKFLRNTFVIAVVAGTVAATPWRETNAATTAEATLPRTSQWMPDVAERVASLRERTERAAAEARLHRLTAVQNGQWWRDVVATQPLRDRTQ